uniref:Odorant-binding protein 22 n=1 Tax=Streltzoviella insularis TaxID=1206366 RepID=A0A7D5YNQ3_9NEOP|nr:odorant-binding protein 22 [Streltzoviella insularis]
MSQAIVLLCGTFLLASIPFTSAVTDEQKAEIQAYFEKIGAECITDHQISEADITELRARKISSGENVPCFLACMMKKMGIMEDGGNLRKETALELIKEVIKDADELKKIEEYLHSCSHVNTEPIGSGEVSCERAMLAYKCMIDNSSQFGILV